MNRINLTIDGIKVTAPSGSTVLEAALENDIYIPHLCYHADLTPAGVCRLCMVEIEGRPGLVISCKTPAAEGMLVKTDTDAINKVRRITLELLITNHPEDCLACTQNMHCELQRVVDYVGVNRERLASMRRPVLDNPIDDSNPFFIRDLDRCILCGICVRTCEEIQGTGAIDFAFRGFNTKIATFANRPIAESNCESCGECVVRCPVGALVLRKSVRPTREVKTVCTYCGCGCGVYLGVRGDQIVSARGDEKSPVSQGYLCVKGRFGWEFIHHADRLKTPLIKKDGEFEEASWDEALDLIAEKFGQYKGDEFAALSSARTTNEDNYVFQKFTRAVMQTNNVDHCARL